MAEELDPEIGERPLADPAGEVRLSARQDEGRDARSNEGDDDERERVEIAGLDAVVDGELRQIRREEGDARVRDEGGDCESRAGAVRACEAQEHADSPARLAPRPVLDPCAALVREMASELPDLHPCHHLLQEAVLVNLAEHWARLEQLGLCAPSDDPPVVEDDHLVRECDRGQSVGDDDRRPPAHHLAQARADPGLGRRVDRGRRVVEDEDARVDEQRPGDRDALSLTSGQCDAPLPDDGVVAVWQLENELVGLRGLRGCLDRLERRVGHAERDVVADRCREEERVLRDDADLPTERAAREIADVDAVDAARDRPSCRRSAARAWRASSSPSRSGR